MTEFLPPEPTDETSPEDRVERDFDAQAKKDFISSAKNPNHAKWRKDAAEDFDFVAGGAYDDTGQWRKDDLDKLKKQNRPIITMNRTEPLVEGIVGAEVNNRQETSYQAREPADKKVAMALMEVAKWARDNDVEEEESDAFRNTIISGMGWTKSFPEYSEDLDGKFTVISTDPLGHYWDVDARRPNLADARYVGYVEAMSRDKGRAMFPGEKLEDNVFGVRGLPSEDDERAAKSPTDYDDPALQGVEGAETSTTIKVLEYQAYTMEPAYRILDPGTGQLSSPVDVVEFNKMRRAVEARGAVMARFGTPVDPPEGEAIAPLVFRFLLQEKRVYYRAFYSGSRRLGERERNSWRNGFTMQCMTGRRHHRRNTWYGLVRPMKDPQRYLNSFMSASIHHYNSNPKGGMMYEEGAMENPEELEAKLAHPSPNIELASGGLARVKMIDPAPPSNALDRMIQIVSDMPPLVTGVSMEFVGLASRDQPIGLEQTRKLATMSIVASIFSSLRRYRKQSGRLLFDYIKDYIPLETIQRVLSEDSRPLAQQIKDSNTLKYDIHVDDAPLSPSIKATVFSIFKDMLQFLPPETAPIYLPAFLEWSPLPQGLVEKLLAGIDKAKQPQPMAILGQLLELRNLAAEAHEKESKAELNEAKADSEEGKPRREETKMALDAIDSLINLEQAKLQAQSRSNGGSAA